MVLLLITPFRANVRLADHTAGTGVGCYTRLTDKGDFRGCLGPTKEFFGSQHGLVLRRPLYFFNDYHIDERLRRFQFQSELLLEC